METSKNLNRKMKMVYMEMVARSTRGVWDMSLLKSTIVGMRSVRRTSKFLVWCCVSQI